MANSYKNYAVWQRARIEALDRFDWNCVMCGTETKCIHHLDGTKLNHSIDNLISLCTSCHIGYFHTRDKKTRLFQFWIYRVVFKRLETLSKNEDVPMSAIANQAIEEFLNRGDDS